MVSSLAKSMALASIFALRPTTAFTASQSLGASSTSTAAMPRSPKSALHASGADDNSPQRRPSLASSHDNTLDDIVGDLPLSPPNDHTLPHQISLHPKGDIEPRSSEFDNLEPLLLSPARRSRLESEARYSNIYISSGSDGYWDLRDEIEQLESDLRSALDVGVGESAVDAIRSTLRRAHAKDPEHVYKVTSAAARSAERMGREVEMARYRAESARAKRMLPQFNLEGLWVGKYGSHGFEMINVTYSGDHLIAYKVTGDKNIPRGEVSFTANLIPEIDEAVSGPNHNNKLDPILLSETSAKKWGTRRLPRFPGRGHAAEPGFVNHQYLEGQLVVIGEGDYFSFAWVPLEHQIFFGRPSPELTLKMLRQGGGAALTAGTGLDVPGPDASMREMTDYAARCLEVTADAVWDDMSEGRVDPFSSIWHGDEAEHCYFE